MWFVLSGRLIIAEIIEGRWTRAEWRERLLLAAGLYVYLMSLFNYCILEILHRDEPYRGRNGGAKWKRRRRSKTAKGQPDLKHCQFLDKFLVPENVASSKLGGHLRKKRTAANCRLKGSQGEHMFNMIETSPIWLKRQDLLHKRNFLPKTNFKCFQVSCFQAGVDYVDFCQTQRGKKAASPCKRQPLF